MQVALPSTQRLSAGGSPRRRSATSVLGGEVVGPSRTVRSVKDGATGEDAWSSGRWSTHKTAIEDARELCTSQGRSAVYVDSKSNGKFKVRAAGGGRGDEARPHARPGRRRPAVRAPPPSVARRGAHPPWGWAGRGAAAPAGRRRHGERGGAARSQAGQAALQAVRWQWPQRGGVWPEQGECPCAVGGHG